MALVYCIECNREISDKAKSCPGCGHPNVKTKSTKASFTSTNPISKQNQRPNSNINTCPSCQSENTQSIKTMCLAGTSSNSTTVFGISSALDIGVGRINTTSQTELAKKHLLSQKSPVSIVTSIFDFCGVLSIIWRIQV